MEFLLVFNHPTADAKPDPADMQAMGRFAAELARNGTLKCGFPLADADQAARIDARSGSPLVSDGPFAETKEVMGGAWIIEAADRDEAIDIARRTPHARAGVVEVHKIHRRHRYDDSGTGTPFLFVFKRVPGLTDPDDSKFRAMIDFADDLAAKGQLFETTPLAQTPPAARVVPNDGKPLVLDGPFAEAKELVGGYSLVRAADRATAVELATRYPHTRWAPVEVREILFFDRIP